MSLYFSTFKTTLGHITIKATDAAITAIHLNQPHDELATKKSSHIPKHVLDAKQRICQYCVDGKISTHGLPLDFGERTPFQRKIYQTLTQVPFGTTISYGELAKKAGFPQASRAVGHAMRANPFPILVPCHRVILQNGRLGGFSAGEAWKIKLLKWEAQPHYNSPNRTYLNHRSKRKLG